MFSRCLSYTGRDLRVLPSLLSSQRSKNDDGSQGRANASCVSLISSCPVYLELLVVVVADNALVSLMIAKVPLYLDPPQTPSSVYGPPSLPMLKTPCATVNEKLAITMRTALMGLLTHPPSPSLHRPRAKKQYRTRTRMPMASAREAISHFLAQDLKEEVANAFHLQRLAPARLRLHFI